MLPKFKWLNCELIIRENLSQVSDSFDSLSNFLVLNCQGVILCLGGELSSSLSLAGGAILLALAVNSFIPKFFFFFANKSNTFVPLNMFSKLTQSHHASVIPWDKHGEEKNIQGLSSPKLCSSALFQNDDKH